MIRKIFPRSLLLGVAAFSAIDAAAQLKSQLTGLCNPLNLSYRFQLEQPSRREAADPTVVSYKGAYYLFASKSGCYWSSPDLLDWKMISSQDLPWEDYAPTVVAIQDTLYFMATSTGQNSSSRSRTIFKTADPASGRWNVAVPAFEKVMSDPDLFLDDNGKVYFYYGTSNRTPIYGVELDRKTFTLKGEPVGCLNSELSTLGWDRPGDYNTSEKRPFIEGAWMNKYQGKYYLQYSTPGTQYKSYADAVYVADTPLGPFTVQATNPFSYKPEGFIAGAGHGSTFQDKFGNYWHMASMTISVKHQFERRLGLWPVFFDKDGTMYAYTGFGDFPHAVPQKRMAGPEDYPPSGLLLSYHKPVEVSSALAQHPKENVTGEDVRQYWSAATGNEGEWALIDLQQAASVRSVQINFAEEGSTLLGRFDSIYHQYLLEYSTNKKSWKTLADKRANNTDVPHDYLELAKPVKARYLRLTNYRVPDGKFALSGLRVFGKGTGKPPQSVTSFSVRRDTADARNVTLCWPKHGDAVGYNIRYGVAPDKLYLNYQVLGTDSLTIHSLSKQQDYYFTIDAFNENGITKGSNAVSAKQLTK